MNKISNLKHLLCAITVLVSCLNISAQTMSILPFDGSKSYIYPIGLKSPNTTAFTQCDNDETIFSVYDINLTPLFTYKNTAKAIIESVYCYDFSSKTGYDPEPIYFTQNLFNNDDAFEYILLEGLRYDDYGYLMGGTKLSIMTSTSTTPIATIEPGCKIGRFDDIEFMYFGEGNPFYIVVGGSFGDNDSSQTDVTYWYKWDSVNSSLQMVKTEKSTLFAHPNPVNAGETVSLNINTQPCDIAVFSMHGQLVKSVSTSDATLDTNGLAPGHYTYKVASNGRQIGTGRLIIK